MIIEVGSEEQMKELGERIGRLLVGGEIIELIGDVGSGKTTLTKGIAIGLGITEYIQSPSFTINRVYKGRDDITLVHYDFYRLDSVGIMGNEINETINEPKTITIIEWASLVSGILPTDRLSIEINTVNEDSRLLKLKSNGAISSSIESRLNK